jgi:hypothetical protein
MIESGLQQLITPSADFGAIAEDRLYPVLLPEQSPLPAATYQLISTVPLYTLEERVNVTEIRIQFDTWAERYGDAKQLMAAINSAIDNFSGDLPDGTHVFGVQLAACNDLFEEAARTHRTSADYLIQFVG